MSAADVAALREMAREFTEGFNTGNVDRLMRFYGDRYVDINLRRPLQSHQERREYFAGLVGGGLRIEVHPDEIIVEGDLAFVRGHIELSGTRTTELRYLEIVRKTPDGWKAMWGMDGPVQENQSGADTPGGRVATNMKE